MIRGGQQEASCFGETLQERTERYALLANARDRSDRGKDPDDDPLDEEGHHEPSSRGRDPEDEDQEEVEADDERRKGAPEVADLDEDALRFA